MPYNTKHIKLTFGGTVAGQDIWSNSFSLTPSVVANAEAAFEALSPNSFVTLATNFYTVGGGSMATYNSLDYIKLALIGENGKTIGEPKQYDFAPRLFGKYTGSVIPQSSIVISTLSAIPRGLASKGRFFPPSGFSDVSGTDGRLAPAAVTSLMTKVKTFLDAINTAGGTGVNQVKLSILSSVGAGATQNISGFRIGNLVDVQRRRRNRLTETYVEDSLSA